MPTINGSGENLEKLIEDLDKEFDNGMPICAKIIRRMKEKLEIIWDIISFCYISVRGGFMENRLFLNCSLYTEEKSIPLYSESPLLKAPNIEDDLIIYEDAQYFGRISISENEKLIRKIKILLNDTEIGYVDFQKKVEILNLKNSGGVSQPFLLQCDLVELCIKIIYEDDSIEYLYTPYLLCVSKSEDDRENIKIY